VSSPTADVSVRVAWADDAPAIADVQLRAWPALYGGLLPADAIPSGPEALDQATAAWRASLSKPGDARNRVLVALERNRVTGFAITGPASDPDCDPVADAELQELTVDPGERAKGHASRLLQAAADTMAADRFTRAVTWVLSGDDALRTFLTDAGWAPDSAHRELDLDGSGTTLVKQVRLHTALS
jgi:GNAT superfamily N-acetyltransferase